MVSASAVNGDMTLQSVKTGCAAVVADHPGLAGQSKQGLILSAMGTHLGF